MKKNETVNICKDFNFAILFATSEDSSFDLHCMQNTQYCWDSKPSSQRNIYNSIPVEKFTDTADNDYLTISKKTFCIISSTIHVWQLSIPNTF